MGWMLDCCLAPFSIGVKAKVGDIPIPFNHFDLGAELVWIVMNVNFLRFLARLLSLLVISFVLRLLFAVFVTPRPVVVVLRSFFARAIIKIIWLFIRDLRSNFSLIRIRIFPV